MRQTRHDSRAGTRRPTGVGTIVLLLTALVATLTGGALLSPAQAGPDLVFTEPVEGYAGYQPQTKCIRKPKPGMLLFSDALVLRGGVRGGISRDCAGSSVSEHKESRAFDWTLDVARKKDRQLARAFLAEIFATDAEGNAHALARRMGIMYILWNDKQWSSYRGFKKTNYLHSACRSKKKCSKTLRHRDHMHISLTRAAARGRLSWYQAQHSD